MLESTRTRLGLLLSVSLALSGCQAAALQGMTAAPKATGTTGFQGEKINAPGINGNGEANPNGNGNGNNGKGGSGAIGNPASPAATSAPTPSGNVSEPAEPGAAKPPTSGVDVGLSTFFDTYNFNFPVPAGQSLGTVANLSQKVVPLAGGKVYLQIGLQTAAQTASTQRQPLNVSFVFDRSGSMYGEKIAYSRTAAERMVDQLDSQDTFSLVTFDSAVSTLIMPAFAVAKDAWKQSIRAIKPGSATNIDGGMAEGYKQVRSQFKPDAINRVILMSDGEANVGIIDKETLGERASANARDGITLSTIGVGTDFNEQFMTHLAEQGLGSYYYVNSEDAAL